MQFQRAALFSVGDLCIVPPYPVTRIPTPFSHAGDSGYDILSRFFAPWMGIDEDHVTGSAHACLAPFWQARLGGPSMSARQCSKRGGDLQLKVDQAAGRVLLSGSAKIVISGIIHL